MVTGKRFMQGITFPQCLDQMGTNAARDLLKA